LGVFLILVPKFTTLMAFAGPGTNLFFF